MTKIISPQPQKADEEYERITENSRKQEKNGEENQLILGGRHLMRAAARGVHNILRTHFSNIFLGYTLNIKMIQLYLMRIKLTLNPHIYFMR